MTDKHVRELVEYKDMPYTVIGRPAFRDSIGFFLSGEGIKKIVEQMREGEDLRITFYPRGQLIEIVDTHHRYTKEIQE